MCAPCDITNSVLFLEVRVHASPHLKEVKERLVSLLQGSRSDF